MPSPEQKLVKWIDEQIAEGAGMTQPDLQPVPDELTINHTTHVWCFNCNQHQPLVITKLVLDGLDEFPWCDLVCGSCHWIVATLSRRG